MANVPFDGLTAPVVLDGAWATELHSMGLDPRACSDAWNLDHPDRVEAVARSYVRAGSQVILTNTFGANRIALSFYGMTANVAEINRGGVRLSRAAANGRARVFGSVGPSRKSLSRAEVTEATLAEAFAEQASLLAEGGADALVLETFTDLDELQLALFAAKKTGLPVVASLVFLGDALEVTTSKTTPETAARVLEEAGADAIGSNCGSMLEMITVCRRFRTATLRPLWIKPNAGLPIVIDGIAKYPSVPEGFTSGLGRLIDAGADMLGGCCGTSPKVIEAIAAMVKRVPGPPSVKS